MNYIFINNKSIHNEGGLKNSSNYIYQILYPNCKFLKYTKLYELFSIIFSIKKDDKLIIFGYADKTIIFCFFLILIFNKKNIIYFPAFHPWHTLRRKNIAYIYEKTLFRLFLHKPKLILCLSEYEKKYLYQLSGVNTLEAINLSSFSYNISDTSLTKKDNSIIFVGRDDKNKNLNEFIRIAHEIMSITNKYNFIVVTNKIRESSEKIKIKVKISNQELSEIYLKSKAIIVTSEWESFSLVGLEAINSGAKLICNNNVMLGNEMKNYPSLIMNSYNNIYEVIKFIESKIDNIEKKSFIKNFTSKENNKKILDLID